MTGFLSILKLKSLEEYIKKYRDALIIQTGSGGYQFYYGIPAGMAHNLRNSTNINGIKGLDVRGNGGYVVAPGSIHPNGNEYKIIHGSLSTIPFMPDELYALWYFHDHPDLSEDDFNESRTTININDDRLSLLVKTAAMIFKKTPDNEGNELLMAFSGAMALRDIGIEETKLILKDAANLNHWNGKINYATVQDSYKRVEMQKSGHVPDSEKFKTYVKGYTTLKRIIMENKQNYAENCGEIIRSLEAIFEHLDDSIQIINSAYDNNDDLSIETMKNLYKSITKMDLKQLELDNAILKLKKIVYVSISSLLHATRLKHKGKDGITIIDDEIYIKVGKTYKSDSNNAYIKSILNEIFNNNLSSRAKLEIITQIGDLCRTVDYDDAMSFIKFKNDFIYNLKTQEIKKFIGDLFVIKQFNFDYNPDAECPLWLNFINTSIRSDDIPVLQEFIGYTLHHDLPAQNFLILKGPTRSGKGTTLRLLSKMLGEVNISSIPASTLFAKYDIGHDLSSLEGKLANIDGEVPPQELKNIANLKKLSGKDTIHANEKYQIPHDFLYLGKLIFALNSLPEIELNDEEISSFFSRILIINYIKSHIDDQNTDLDIELSEEISGTFNWAISGLKRLKSNNFRFSITQRLEDKQRLYILESDPLKVFSDEKIIPGDCEYEPKALYTMFNKFCSDNNIDPSMNVRSLRSFQLKLSDKLQTREDLNFQKVRKGHNMTTYYCGFCIKNEENKGPDGEDNKNPPKGNKDPENFNTGSLQEGTVKQSLMEEQELKNLEKNKNSGLSEELQAQATQKIFELLESEYEPVHELDNIRRNLNYLSDEQFKILIDAMIKSSIVKMDGRRLEKIKSDPEKPSKELIYRKSVELATDLPIEDSYTRSEWHYYAFDNAKINLESKAWIKFSMKSQEVPKKEFENMRGARL